MNSQPPIPYNKTATRGALAPTVAKPPFLLHTYRQKVPVLDTVTPPVTSDGVTTIHLLLYAF